MKSQVRTGAGLLRSLKSVATLAVLAAGLPAVSCREAGESAAPAGPSAASGACSCAASAGPATPVTASVLAWLSKARSLHHAADIAEDGDRLDRAISLLDELASGPRPAAPAPEIDEVIADTRARLAELRSRGEAFEPALSDIERGLLLAREPSYFRGHLLEVQGLVYERQARALAKLANHDEAVRRARDEAIRVSLEAVRIQNEVIRRTLGEKGPGASGEPERDR